MLLHNICNSCYIMLKTLKIAHDKKVEANI